MPARLGPSSSRPPGSRNRPRSSPLIHPFGQFARPRDPPEPWRPLSCGSCLSPGATAQPALSGGRRAGGGRRGMITRSWVARSHVRATEQADFRSDLPAAVPAGFLQQDVTSLPDHQPRRLAGLCGLSPPLAGSLDHPRRSGGPARRRSDRLEPYAPARRHAHLKPALKAEPCPAER